MLALGESQIGDEFDLDALTKAIPTKTSDELIAMIEWGTDGYVEEAVALAKTELESRGRRLPHPNLDTEELDSKARVQAKLDAERDAIALLPLSKALRWICFLEGAQFSIGVAIYQSLRGRGRASADAVKWTLFGWLAKGALYFVAIQIAKLLS